MTGADSAVSPATVRERTRLRRAEEWSTWQATTPAMRRYLTAVGVLALVLPWALLPLAPAPGRTGATLTVVMLVVVSGFHIELARAMIGGRSSTQQPHKALSAWAFAAALLLPAPAVLLVVVLTYLHARWRGLRVMLWQWVGSASFLVLAACAALTVRHLVLGPDPLVASAGGETGPGTAFGALLLAALAFLAVEAGLFWGSVLLNHADQEAWLRGQLTSAAFYLTETCVLAVGGLLAVLWSEHPWYALLALPVHVLATRAALLQPVRDKAATATLLATQNAALAEANQFKVDLLAMLAHEVGNPLTTVVGWSQVAEEAAADGDAETTRSALVSVRRGARRTHEVLADITAMMAADTGALVARPEQVELLDALRDLDHGATGAPPVDVAPGLTVLVQRGHLLQVLGNLLSNAEKYAGGATSVSATSDGHGTVHVAVTDGGTVPLEVRGRLFDRYARAEEHATQRGTGIGLHITRALARANGGDVTYRPAHSEPGLAGSVFTVSLPEASRVGAPAPSSG